MTPHQSFVGSVVVLLLVLGAVTLFSRLFPKYRTRRTRRRTPQVKTTVNINVKR
jgi:hypothetical protein